MLSSSHTEIQYASRLAERLWPICRSICGGGLRESLEIVNQEIGLTIHKYQTGTKAFDWVIPQEWNVKGACIETLSGKKIIDFAENNLHLMNYSTAFEGILSKAELKSHLYYLPAFPDAIPYRTSYYKKEWGFCLSHHQFEKMTEANYNVVVDTEHVDGFMEVGEQYIKGDNEKEFLLWTHFCHPSMANDQLSGPITLILFAKRMSGRQNLPLSIRLCFGPETIGSLAYLSENHHSLKRNMVAGLACVLTGGDGPLSYRQTRSGIELIDEIFTNYLSSYDNDYEVNAFNPAFGNDQRQFCSPGVNLPMGSISYTGNEKSSEYHTSMDDLNRLNISNIVDMVNVLEDVYDRICNARVFFRKQPNGELFLSKHGLYPQNGVDNRITSELREAILWLLNLSDGKHSFEKIIKLSNCQEKVMNEAVRLCVEKGLIQKLT